MSAPVSTYLSNKLLDHLFGGSDYTPPNTLYLALFTVTPSDAGGGTEATGGGYARCAVTNNLTNFPAASGGVKTNANDIPLFTASGSVSSGSNIVAIGIFDASTSGNLLWWGPVDTAQAITTGDVPTIAAGQLNIALGGAFGLTVRNGLLDLVFGKQTYTRASTVYGGLFTSPNASDGTGGGTEVSGGSYARKSITNNSTNFPSASSGSKSLGALQAFATATGSWGTVTDFGLFDASSGGNLLWFKTLDNARTISAGQTFRIASGGLVLSLD